MVGQLISNIAVLAGAAGGGGEDREREAIRVWKRMQLPDFDMRELTPPELALVAEFFPETYEAVVPQELKLPEDSPIMRQAQLRSLGQLEGYAREGLPLGERIAAEQSARAVQAESGRTQADIMRNLAARGRLGGGNEAAIRAAGGQTAADLARDLGSDLQRAAIENRYRANLAAGQMGGQIRGQDIALSKSQADATNRFNEAVARARNEAARYAAEAGNRANLYNVQTRQDLANQNVMNRYQTELDNLNRSNALRQQGFQNRVTRASGLTNQLQARAQSKWAEQAAKANQIQGIGSGVDNLITNLVV